MTERRAHQTIVATTTTKPAAKRRVIATGKRENGRWQVRTSLWRYLASTVVSQ